MYAPFVEDSDDKLSQLAQLQIFLTLLSSLALRATPPSAFVSSAVTVILFVVPLIGVALETPLFEVMGKPLGVLTHVFRKIFPNLKAPQLNQAAIQVMEEEPNLETEQPASASQSSLNA